MADPFEDEDFTNMPDSLAGSGSLLIEDEALAIEQALAETPDDIPSRTKLLGYYFRHRQSEIDDAALDARLRHLTWLIEHAPAAPILGLPQSTFPERHAQRHYQQAKDIWLKAISQSMEEPEILWHASRFFFNTDAKLSEELLLRGKALEATNDRWPAALGLLYSLQMWGLPAEEPRRHLAEQAYEQYQLAHDLLGSMGKLTLGPDLIKAAFAADRLDVAARLASEMLADDSPWDDSDRIHHAHLIPGRIALRHGNLDEAKTRLLLAARIEGSPVLKSFGPNMMLASELLAHGESEAVLQYFALCSTFWIASDDRLEQWVADVKAARTPQFGGNLIY